jgi:hypothetical protein
MALDGANKDLGQDVIPKGIVARGRELLGAALANRYVQLSMGAGFGLFRMSKASVPFTPLNVASGIAVTTAAVEGTRVAVKGIQKVYGHFNRQPEVKAPVVLVDDKDKMEVSESDGDMIFFSTKELKHKHDSDQSSEKLNISASVSEGDEIVEDESPDDENRDRALGSSSGSDVYVIDGKEYGVTYSPDSEVTFNLVEKSAEQTEVPVEQAQVSAEQAQEPAEQVQLPGESSLKRLQVVDESEPMDIELLPPPVVLSKSSEKVEDSVEKKAEASKGSKRKRVENQAEASVEKQPEASRYAMRRRVEKEAAAPVEKQAVPPKKRNRR